MSGRDKGAAAAAFGLLLTIGGASAAHAEASEPLRAKADGAMLVLLSGDCGTTPAAFEPVVADSGFKSFDAATRAALLGGAAVCAMTGGDVETAYAYARRGADEPGADGANWAVRFSLALANSQPDDAVRSFYVLASKHPTALKEVDGQQIAAAYRGLKADPARLTFLDALNKADWRPDDPADSGDAFRLEHVRLLLGANRVAEARSEAADVADPVQRLSLQVDDRFAPARPQAQADLRAAAKAALDRARLAASAHPERLSGPVSMASLHLTLGEPETALRVLDAALERHRQEGDSAFEDIDPQLSWARDLRAQALFALGRDAEGVEAMSAAASDGEVDFSRMVNLAGVLTFTNRAREALSALEAVDPASLTNDSRAWLEAARACALAEAGRKSDSAAAASEVDRLAPESLQARTHAKLCVNDLDGAAALYARRLGDPDLRLPALLALQEWRQGPALKRSRWGTRRQEQLASIRARPDVRAAVAKAGGRIGSVALVDVHGRL